MTNEMVKDSNKVAEIFAQYLDDNQNRDEENDTTTHVPKETREPRITSFSVTESMLG